MTLEKDKEDQSKYYLCYPKPPVLDMKWKNHNINVVEWANFLQFPPLLGESVVLCLMESLTPIVKFEIFIIVWTKITTFFKRRVSIIL